MKKTLKLLILMSLIIAIAVLTTACNKTPDIDANSSNDNKSEGTISAEDIVGSYEGQWAMTPNTNPLVSLIISEKGKYELYVSIMGLMEEGTYSINEERVVEFLSIAGNTSAVKGKYELGTIDVAFLFNNTPTSITYMQVGSPDDVYKEFLGDYVTKVMGNTDVTLSLLEGRKYINSLSKETGIFKIANGEITLIPDGSEGKSVTGKFNVASKEIEIKMSVMPGTPEANMIFKQASEDEFLVYKGLSSVGMSGSTEVTLIFKPGNVFELVTTKPRGNGIYEITEEAGKTKIVLTYTEPDKRPDGTEFKMTGTVDNKDLYYEGNSITIELVEYIVNMGEKDSIMDLGEVKFTLAD